MLPRDTTKILIASSSTQLAMLLTASYISRQGRFVLDRVTTIQSCIERVGRESYDLVLADFELPDGSAMRIQEALNDRVPVVALVAPTELRTFHHTAHTWFFDYIIKTPSAIADLKNRTDQLLKQWKIAEKLRALDDSLGERSRLPDCQCTDN